MWRRFRDEVTGASAVTWKTRSYIRAVDLMPGQAPPANGDYRVELDEATNRAWIASPDFRRLASLCRTIKDPHPALYRARFVEGDHRAHIEQLGPGRPEWGIV